MVNPPSWPRIVLSAFSQLARARALPVTFLCRSIMARMRRSASANSASGAALSMMANSRLRLTGMFVVSEPSK